MTHVRNGRCWALGLAGCLVLTIGCDALRSEQETPSPRAEAEVESETPEPEASIESPPAPPSLLDGVLDRAIVPPPEGGSTYRVDAYLAALLVEQLRRSPLPFTAWRSESPDPAGPSAGYRVGPLSSDDVWSRLGLQEGDIVTELSGVSTTDQGWVSEAIGRGENRVTVTVFREGMSSVLSYRLMGAMAWNDLRLELAPPAELAMADELGSDEPVAGAGVSEGGGALASPEAGVAPADTGRGASPGGGASPGRGSGASRPSGSRPSPPRPSAGSRGSGSTSSVAQCSSATQCTLKKSYFDGIVRSPSKLERQANIVPAIRNDVHSGYKLKTVRPGSAVAQLGFRSGDKITHINGRDLTNDLEAMQLYMALASTRRFRVRFVRGGSARTKTIDVV